MSDQLTGPMILYVQWTIFSGSVFSRERERERDRERERGREREGQKERKGET